MPIFRAATFFFFCSWVFLLSACSGNETSNINSSSPNINQISNQNLEAAASDDVEELGKIVRLPLVPEEATYKETVLNNNEPNKKKIVAVLKFFTEDANQIAANAGKYSAPAPLDVDAENWFPPELIAKSQETGDESLKGGSFSAQDFLQPPYTNGRLTRINDTNYFVLDLFTF